jgi:hypothetical protein
MIKDNTWGTKLTFQVQSHAVRLLVVMPHFILLVMTDGRKENELDRKTLKTDYIIYEIQ